jgi:hypothetical protein
LTALLKEEELDLLHYEEFSEGSDLQGLWAFRKVIFTENDFFFFFLLGFPNLRRALASMGTFGEVLPLVDVWVNYAAVGRWDQ